jgi:hypothetical protein
MTDPQIALRIYLEEVRNFAGQLPTKYHYRNIYDFVLREGRFFEPQPRTDPIRLRPIGECFRNALLTMMKTGLQYAEGYAVSGSKIPVLHAWNVGSDGSVIDSTWEPVGSAYFGIIFPLSIVRRARTSVLDDWASGWPVLRKSAKDLQNGRCLG